MSSERIDYTSMIVDLEAKKAALEALLFNFRSAMAIGALGPTGDIASIGSPSPSPAMDSIELPTGALLGKSIPSAIKLYLSAVKKKQTIREITTALRDGGVESTASNFESVITGALNRMKGAGEVLRFKDGWGLAELYPDSLRSRLSIASKPSKKQKHAKRQPTSRAPLQAEPKTFGPQKRIEEYVFSKNAAARITSGDVSKALNIRHQTVSLVLSKLAHAGTITKNADGSFDVGQSGDQRLVN